LGGVWTLVVPVSIMAIKDIIMGNNGVLFLPGAPLRLLEFLVGYIKNTQIHLVCPLKKGE